MPLKAAPIASDWWWRTPSDTMCPPSLSRTVAVQTSPERRRMRQARSSDRCGYADSNTERICSVGRSVSCKSRMPRPYRPDVETV